MGVGGIASGRAPCPGGPGEQPASSRAVQPGTADLAPPCCPKFSVPRGKSQRGGKGLRRERNKSTTAVSLFERYFFVRQTVCARSSVAGIMPPAFVRGEKMIFPLKARQRSCSVLSAETQAGQLTSGENLAAIAGQRGRGEHQGSEHEAEQSAPLQAPLGWAASARAQHGPEQAPAA